VRASGTITQPPREPTPVAERERFLVASLSFLAVWLARRLSVACFDRDLNIGRKVFGEDAPGLVELLVELMKDPMGVNDFRSGVVELSVHA